MFKLLTAIGVLVVAWLGRGDTLYNLDQVTPLERELQPLIYDVFSVRYFGVDPVYTQVPAPAVKLWDKTRSYPTHPLDFVITYIKASASAEHSLAVHCSRRLTLIASSSEAHITVPFYPAWDLALPTRGS